MNARPARVNARAAVIAVAAVLVTPLLLSGRGWERLLRLPPLKPARRAAPNESVDLAARLLSRLSRSRLGGVWRDTCLYQSVATCVVLRYYGAPAVLKLGAKRDGET